MPANKVAFTAVGLACIAAAGAGGYFAMRQNTVPTPVAATAPAPTAAEATAPSPVATTERSVQQPPATEAEPAPARTTKPAAAPKRVTVPATVAPPQTATAAAPPKVVAPAPLPQPPAPEPPAPPVSTEPVDRVAQNAPVPPPPPAAPQHTFDELVISSDSVIGLQSDTTVTSEHARVEDRVEARVTRDVKVADRVAIPAGSRAIGYVTQVERGGKFREQAKLAIRFQTIVLPDGTRLPISTAAVEREGDAKGNSSAAKMGGGAIAGTILGAILGGGKGAAVGGLAGAGAGAAAVQAGDRSQASLNAGEPITIRLLSPVTVTIENK